MNHNKDSLIGLVSVLTFTALINLIPAESIVSKAKAVEHTYLREAPPSRTLIKDRVIPVEEEKVVYDSNTIMSPEELKDVLHDAGFRGESLRQAWGVAMKESTGKPMAHNQNSATGDNSYGLFQINMIGNLGVSRMELYNLNSYEELFDPLRNAKIAFEISDGGTDWGAWKGLTPRTREFMAQFPN